MKRITYEKYVELVKKALSLNLNIYSPEECKKYDQMKMNEV